MNDRIKIVDRSGDRGGRGREGIMLN